MPGTPDPVLGSGLLTWVVAGALAAIDTVVPYLLRNRVGSPRSVALAGGVIYAGVCFGTWAGVRYVTDAFIPIDWTDSITILFFSIGILMFVLQAAIPLYSYARWRLLAPLAGLFVVTTLVLFTFLRIGGESDPFFLYAVVFGPLMVGFLCILALLESGLRYLVVRTGFSDNS